MNTNLILDLTPQKEITWGCIWESRWPVVKTPTIISNNLYDILVCDGRNMNENPVEIFTIKHGNFRNKYENKFISCHPQNIIE